MGSTGNEKETGAPALFRGFPFYFFFSFVVIAIPDATNCKRETQNAPKRQTQWRLNDADRGLRKSGTAAEKTEKVSIHNEGMNDD